MLDCGEEFLCFASARPVGSQRKYLAALKARDVTLKMKTTQGNPSGDETVACVEVCWDRPRRGPLVLRRGNFAKFFWEGLRNVALEMIERILTGGAWIIILSTSDEKSTLVEISRSAVL